MASNSSLFDSKSRRRARMRSCAGPLVSERTYNAVLGLTVLYGIIANIIICAFFTNVALSLNPLIMIIGYMVLAIAGATIAARSSNPGISFLGYNMIVLPAGLMLSTVVYTYGGISSLVVIQAFNYTMIITAAMIGLSILFPAFFSGLGRFLFSALIGIIIASVFSMIFGIGSMGIAFVAAIVFSLYIGYDFWKAQQYPKTIDNAIDSAIDIYLDILNLFLRILQILGNGNKR